MKKNSFLWAALSMTAALVMTACTTEDNTVETPTAPQAEVKTIPYSVTVGQGGDAAATRATVDNDMKTLKFAAGDKLYVFDGSSVVKGVLTLKSGDEGKSSGATFEGSLSYTGDEPAADLELNAVLVGSKSKLSTITDDRFSAGTYPTTSYCDDVATAVEEWSWLAGIGTYGGKSFTLSQSTTFLNFEITFEDGTESGTTLTAVVKQNSTTTFCTADVTTKTEDGKVVAKFVLPLDDGYWLDGATVKMGDKEAISFGGDHQQLLGKVYNVKKTQYTPISAATTSDYGKVVCAAGHLHTAKTAVPAGCTAVGILGKVTTTGHGLILALKDATSQNWNTINGWESVTTYAGTTLKVLPDDDARGTNLTSYTTLGTTAVSNWAVAQKSDYVAIFTNLGSTTGDSNGKTYDANVNAYITTGVGGTAISGYYWSATDRGNHAWLFLSDYWYEYDLTYSHSVRPVLAF